MQARSPWKHAGVNWVYSVCSRKKKKKCWEDEVSVLRESSLFAAGVCRQVGSARASTSESESIKYKIWQFKAGKKNNRNLRGFSSVSLWESHHLPGA